MMKRDLIQANFDKEQKDVVTRTETLNALNDLFKQAEDVPEMAQDEINREIADVRSAKKVVNVK